MYNYITYDGQRTDVAIGFYVVLSSQLTFVIIIRGLTVNVLMYITPLLDFDVEKTTKVVLIFALTSLYCVDLKLRVRNQNLIFSFLNQNICRWNSKESSH